MIRKLVLQEIRTYGGGLNLANRLLIYGVKPYIPWLINKASKTDAPVSITKSLRSMAHELNIPEARVRYAYYRKIETPLRDLQARKEFAGIVEVLTHEFPHPDLWLDLAPYAYEHMRNLAIELLVARHYLPKEICEVTGAKKSRVYRVRRNYLIRYVQMKGDNNNDTEYDK